MKIDKVLLIGNGPSVTQYELGGEIDQFEVVVRFNNFVTEGFEAHVGSKTDVWAVNSVVKDINKHVKNRTEKMMPQNFKFLVPRAHTPFDKTLNMIINNYPGKKVQTVDPKLTFLLRDEINGSVLPTIGTIAVQHFLTKANEVVLHGFDLFTSDIERFVPEHYYRDRRLPALLNHHEIEREKAWLQFLYKNGKVKLLTDIY